MQWKLPLTLFWLLYNQLQSALCVETQLAFVSKQASMIYQWFSQEDSDYGMMERGEQL